MRCPRIKSIKAMNGKKLEAIFEDGTQKVYDCKPIINDEPFNALKSEALFKNVRVECNGYGIAWND